MRKIAGNAEESKKRAAQKEKDDTINKSGDERMNKAAMAWHKEHHKKRISAENSKKINCYLLPFR